MPPKDAKLTKKGFNSYDVAWTVKFCSLLSDSVMILSDVLVFMPLPVQQLGCCAPHPVALCVRLLPVCVCMLASESFPVGLPSTSYLQH